MNKYLVVTLIVLGLTSCSAKDEQYYRTHPKVLQQAMKDCPNKQPSGLSCQQIEKVAVQMNTLAYQLQYNPQGFGAAILKLQQTIASQQIELTKSNANNELHLDLNKNKKELAERLAVVKWLESPES